MSQAGLTEALAFPTLIWVASRARPHRQVKMGSFVESKGSVVEMSETPKTKPKIEYVAPPDDVLANFAHQVCQRLGGKHTDREIERGFADFLKVIARILAKNMNRVPEFLAKLMSHADGDKLNALE